MSASGSGSSRNGNYVLVESNNGGYYGVYTDGPNAGQMVTGTGATSQNSIGGTAVSGNLTAQDVEGINQQQNNINQLKEAQKASRIAALDKAKNTALTALDTEKATVAPTYYDKRNQAAASSEVGALNFAQHMAARGIKGAAGAMPEIYRNASLQGQIGALDQQEASNMAAIEKQRSSIESGYASDVAAAEAEVDAQAMESAIDQYNADRQYELQQSAMTSENSLNQQKQTDAERQDWIDTIGQYSNNYQAEINRVQNDGDPTNDWKIAYLQAARNKKLADQAEAQAKAAQQDIQNDQRWAQINKTGRSGSSGSSGSNSSSGSDNSSAPLSNPFDDTGNKSNQISGYDVTRLDNYINGKASSFGNDPNKLMEFIQSNNNIDANFRTALITRLKQRAS